jgi:hypothetical protein
MEKAGTHRWRSSGIGVAALVGLFLVVQGDAYAQGRRDRLREPPGKPPRAVDEGPRPGGEMLPGPGGPFGVISPEQTEQLMEFIREHFPERYKLLRRMRERNPELFQRRIAEAAPRVLELLLRMKENPELGELMIQQQRLEEELHERVDDYFLIAEEDDAEREELRAAVEDTVSQLVELRLQRRRMEIDALQHRLEEQRERLEEDWAARDEIAADEVRKLLRRRRVRDRFRERQFGDR